MANPQLPDLSHLFPTNFVQRLTNVPFGVGSYPMPTQAQVTAAARLLDKAVVDWDLARSELADHAAIRDKSQVQRPTVTRAFYRAVGHLENMIDSVDRLLRFVAPLERVPALAGFAEMPLPSSAERQSVRDFRNRIAHGDDDIERGIAGKGPVPATVHPAATNMTIEEETLEYADLARMLEQVHDFLRAAISRGAAKSAKAR